MRRTGLYALVLLVTFVIPAWSQEQGAGTTEQKTIKKVPIKQTAPDSGEEMYREYCAVCHGKEGKGDGPAASEFKVPPPDLTMLAKKNNGKYPGEYVGEVLRFGVQARAHGTKDMATWGPLLASLHTTAQNDSIVHLRITNLVSYIESLQAK